MASLLFVALSCSNTSDTPVADETPAAPVATERGAATVRMFVPDYYALAEQNEARAIAPQTVSARLCYLVNGSWVGINTVSLADAEKTAVTGAPDGFTGSVYTLHFDGVPVGSYSAGNLEIELLDASGNAVTTGTNASAVSIAKGGSASTTFYTVPTSTSANAGNLAAGEMKFSRAALVQGVEYTIVLSSSGDYPDLVLFGSDGKIAEYHVIDSESEASVILTVDATDVYYLGVWADDGNDIARYTLSFDFGEGTPLSGVLTGTNLHWTAENSPYIVNANILVEEGTELTIDPGVTVQFTGNYYLKVTGTISAVGTKDNPIIFVQSGDNLNYWAGISIDSTTSLNVTNTYTYASGNILKNCMVIGADTPLTLNSATYVDSCTFTGNGNYVNVRSNSLLINNVMDDGVYAYDNSPKIVNNNIKGTVEFEYGYASVINNTIANGSICFYNNYSSFRFTANTVNACSISVYNLYPEAQITGNNFLGYSDVILNVSNCSYANRKTFTFTGNYWGEAQTDEIESKCGSAVAADEKDYNMSFFTDYYDNFEDTKIDFSNWATEPIEGAGYLGDGFIAFDYTINGYNYENGGYYPESTDTALTIAVTPKYHANDIASIRVAQSMTALKEKSWSAYSANQSFTVDTTAIVDGAATIYVQLKDSAGTVSSPVMHEVPFDSPVVTLSITDGTEYSSATSSVTLTYGATDKGNLTQYEFYLDDVKVSFSETSSGWGTYYKSGYNYGSTYSLGLAYMSAGTHTIKVTFWDSARNSTTATATFTINRTVDTSGLAGTAYDATSGQLFKDSNTLYLWHFDENGTEVDSSATLRNYSAGTGGLNGYAQSAEANSISLNLDSNAFSVEGWRKGNFFNIGKSSVFQITSYYMYRYYTTAGGSTNGDSLGFSDSLNDDNWHFWSYVYGGTYMAVYRDGVLVSYRDGLTQELNTNDEYLCIYVGNIDELRISKTARSADEIAAYYAAAKDKVQ